MKNQYFERRKTTAGLLGIIALTMGMICGSNVSATDTNTSVLVADKDSYLNFENANPTVANSNFGGSSILDIFSNSYSAPSITEGRRAIMSFDLSSLTSDPNFIAIISVTLKLGVPTFEGKGGPSDETATHGVNRLLRDFVENQVTWNEYSSGNAWSTAGAVGASDSVNIATGVNNGGPVTYSNGDPGPNTPWALGGLDVTGVTTAWLASPDTTQLGFLVQYFPSNTIARVNYGSTESLFGPGPGPVLLIQAQFIPEPTSVVLFAVGGIVLAMRRRMR